MHEKVWDGFSDLPEEQEHLRKVLRSFLTYRTFATRDLEHRALSVNHLTDAQFERLPSKYLEKFSILQYCIDRNQQFLTHALDCNFLGERHDSLATEDKLVDPLDPDRVHSTLHQCLREWSSDATEERAMCFNLLLKHLHENFGEMPDKSTIKVLVPGAGLGRLVFEIARMGYACEGNETSLFMLLISNHFLNGTNDINEHAIFPFIHQFSNVISAEDQCRPVYIPDVVPRFYFDGGPLSTKGTMTMTAGDFVQVYNQTNYQHYFDAIVTSFFLDTAHNIIEYIEVIHHALKPGGIWINVGPLLYHYESVRGEISLELTFDEVRHVIIQTGFSISHEQSIPMRYTQNVKSMMGTVYECRLFVARKQSSNLVQ